MEENDEKMKEEYAQTGGRADEEPIPLKGSLDMAEELIGLGSLDKAQAVLNANNTKSGRKYYLQSRIYKAKCWYNEQRKQLKKAVKEEPDREDYQKELAELEEFAKTKDYKSAVRRHQMGQAGGVCAEGCTECCVEACCYGTCTCICEGIGNGC